MAIFKKQKFVYKKPEELFRDFMPLRYNEWYKAWQTTHDHEINLGCIYDEPINPFNHMWLEDEDDEYEDPIYSWDSGHTHRSNDEAWGTNDDSHDPHIMPWENAFWDSFHEEYENMDPSQKASDDRFIKFARLKADEISWFVIEKTRITVRELPDRLDNMQHYELGSDWETRQRYKEQAKIWESILFQLQAEKVEKEYTYQEEAIANVIMARRRLKYDQSKEAIRKIYFETFFTFVGIFFMIFSTAFVHNLILRPWNFIKVYILPLVKKGGKLFFIFLGVQLSRLGFDILFYIVMLLTFTFFGLWWGCWIIIICGHYFEIEFILQNELSMTLFILDQIESIPFEIIMIFESVIKSFDCYVIDRIFPLYPNIFIQPYRPYKVITGIYTDFLMRQHPDEVIEPVDQFTRNRLPEWLEMSMETLWVYHHGSLFPLPMDHFLHIQRLTSKRVLKFYNLYKYYKKFNIPSNCGDEPVVPGEVYENKEEFYPVGLIPEYNTTYYRGFFINSIKKKLRLNLGPIKKFRGYYYKERTYYQTKQFPQQWITQKYTYKYDLLFATDPYYKPRNYQNSKLEVNSRYWTLKNKPVKVFCYHNIILGDRLRTYRRREPRFFTYLYEKVYNIVNDRHSLNILWRMRRNALYDSETFAWNRRVEMFFHGTETLPKGYEKPVHIVNYDIVHSTPGIFGHEIRRYRRRGYFLRKRCFVNRASLLRVYHNCINELPQISDRYKLWKPYMVPRNRQYLLYRFWKRQLIRANYFLSRGKKMNWPKVRANYRHYKIRHNLQIKTVFYRNIKGKWMTDRRYTYFNLWDTADPRYMYMKYKYCKEHNFEKFNNERSRFYKYQEALPIFSVCKKISVEGRKIGAVKLQRILKKPITTFSFNDVYEDYIRLSPKHKVGYRDDNRVNRLHTIYKLTSLSPKKLRHANTYKVNIDLRVSPRILSFESKLKLSRIYLYKDGKILDPSHYQKHKGRYFEKIRMDIKRKRYRFVPTEDPLWLYMVPITEDPSFYFRRRWRRNFFKKKRRFVGHFTTEFIGIYL